MDSAQATPLPWQAIRWPVMFRLGLDACLCAGLVWLRSDLVLPDAIRTVRDAKCRQARAELGMLGCALDEYAMSHGMRYPDALGALRPALFRDPWGGSYRYTPP